MSYKHPDTPAKKVELPELKQLKLRLSPYVWAKMMYIRDIGNTEVGFMGVSASSESADLLTMVDIVMPKQRASSCFVKFDDDSIADYFMDMCDQGLEPSESMRIWIHTHPGNSPSPSTVDEETFQRVFGNCSWSVMLIVARDDSIYAKLQLKLGENQPNGFIEIPVEVDYDIPFMGANKKAWKKEYTENLEKEAYKYNYSKHGSVYGGYHDTDHDDYNTGGSYSRYSKQTADDDYPIYIDGKKKEKEPTGFIPPTKVAEKATGNEENTKPKSRYASYLEEEEEESIEDIIDRYREEIGDDFDIPEEDLLETELKTDDAFIAPPED